MKSTGIVRRIDELGRIVIPKEIRKNFKLRTGENIEIFIDNDSIILKKFSMMNRITDLAQELTDSIYTFMKHNIVITDTDNFIACSGPLKKEVLNKNIGVDIITKIEKREKIIESHFKEISLLEGKIFNISYITNPIIKDGEIIGMIIIFSDKEKLGIDQMHIIEIVSSFITKYLEE